MILNMKIDVTLLLASMSYDCKHNVSRIKYCVYLEDFNFAHF